MVWFLVALVLLVAALIVLWLDWKRRQGTGSAPTAAGAHEASRGHGFDDDEVGRTAPVDESELDPEVEQSEQSQSSEPSEPFEPSEPGPVAADRADDGVFDDAPGGEATRAEAESDDAVAAAAGDDDAAVDDPAAAADDPAAAATDEAAAETPDGGSDDRRAEDSVTEGQDAEHSGTAGVVGAAAAGAGAVGAGAAAPKLADRVRRFLPQRKPDRSRAVEPQAEQPAEPEPADPLAGSPVVHWLEAREFAPTPTPAPDFQHGDFAGGLPALGAVSHGVFRGRRAIMGVAGGRAVLALQRDTASDVILDLSRPDVDAEPGFHDAGEVAALEARTSDFGRLEMIDRDRLADAVRGLPEDVRRIWAEDEWLAATIDDAECPSTWDDTVVRLYDAADALAPLPPVGGRARPLPTEIDPGSPGATGGPAAHPSGGVPDPTAHRAPSGFAAGAAAAGAVGVAGVAGKAAADSAARAAGATDGGEGGAADAPADETVGTADAAESAESQTTPVAASESKRAGHLRLVPERREGVRDLGENPVVADRGDAEQDQTSAPAPADELAGTASAGSAADADDAAAPEEPDPFAEVMDPGGPVASRGDVASDHLEPRPPLSRPSRNVGHSYPEDASVPPLASGATSGESGIKPIGSDDDEEEIRTEVERFDAARTDGGSDLDQGSSGRHADRPADEVPVWLRSDIATPREGGRRRRRAEPDPDEADGDADERNERPGAEPDVERTMRIRLPREDRD